MKKAAIILTLALLAFGGHAYAQKTVKLGHINSSELMQIMPGKDSVQAILEKELADLESQLKTMQAEMEQRYNDYMERQSQMSDLIKRTKQQEIQDMGSRIEAFNQDAQKTMQERQEALLKPIVDRAKKAIEDVAKENGYSYIFDTSANVGAILYQQDSDDIMPLVKKKLGLAK
ncbi:MAG: OmpH family outer membrane protein [Bacteroidales bacterium]|nr:OmpH family outer membrane protein [Bacteroidales bacterium]